MPTFIYFCCIFVVVVAVDVVVIIIPFTTALIVSATNATKFTALQFAFPFVQ